MDNNLTFNETLTIEQFKSKEMVSRLDIKRNPKTGKLFFAYGSKTGAVATAGIPSKPVVSSVTTPDGENFYLLHEEGNGGAPTLATL